MKMMAWCDITLVLLVMAVSVCDGEGLYPKPYLTEDRSATVLKLECKPPPEAVWDWVDVHDLRIFACLGELQFGNCANQTIASMTSAMTKPELGSEVPSIAKVSFAGQWNPSGRPSLTVHMPFTSENHGVYFCTAQYEKGQDLRHYSIDVTVDGSTSGDWRRSPLKKDNFEATFLNAHEVNVTWSPPDGSHSQTFLEGRVTRSFVDKEGQAMTAPRTLFMATETKDFVIDNAGVLLARFQPPSSSGGNYSMTVYVASESCSPSCSYSCRVPYHACVGPDARFCECGHEEDISTSSTPSTEPTVTPSPSEEDVTSSSAHSDCTSTSSTPGLSEAGEAAVGLAVFIVLCFLVLLGTVVLLKRGKLRCFRDWLNSATHNKRRDKTAERSNGAMDTLMETKDADEPITAQRNEPIQTLKALAGKRSRKSRRSRRGQMNFEHADPSDDASSTQHFHEERQESDPGRAEDRHETESLHQPSDDGSSSAEELDEEAAGAAAAQKNLCGLQS